MPHDEPPADEWIIPILGIALALTIAIGLGFLIGQQTPQTATNWPAVCQRLPKAGFTTNCIALRSTIATEAAASRAFWGNLVSFGALIGSMAALAGLIITLRQGQRALTVGSNANDISRQIGQAQVRAYLVTQFLECKLAATGSLTFIVSFHNSGQSPARKTTWLVSAIIHIIMDGQPDRWLQLGREPDLTRSHWRQDIPAGSSWRSYPLLLDYEKREALRVAIDQAQFIAVTVQVTAQYDDVFGLTHGETSCFQGRVSASLPDYPYDPLQRAHDRVYDNALSQLQD